MSNLGNNVVKFSGKNEKDKKSEIIKIEGKPNLVEILEGSEFTDKLKDLLDIAGYVGRFKVRSIQLIKGTPHTQGKLKFSKYGPNFVTGYFHPINKGNDSCVGFTMTVPNGINSEVFLRELIVHLDKINNK